VKRPHRYRRVFSGQPPGRTSGLGWGGAGPSTRCRPSAPLQQFRQLGEVHRHAARPAQVGGDDAVRTHPHYASVMSATRDDNGVVA
jgi:hypothetical protein